MWFGVARISSSNIKSRWYLFLGTDGSTFVFEFSFDHTLVTGLPEFPEATVDYEAVLNPTRETWYIKVTAAGDLDAATIKEIYTIKVAGKYIEPIKLTPDADKVLWFGVAKLDGDLTFKEAGEYAWKVVKQDDSEYIFAIDYNPELVTGIMHSIDFEENGGSEVEALSIEKGQVATKPADPQQKTIMNLLLVCR